MDAKAHWERVYTTKEPEAVTGGDFFTRRERCLALLLRSANGQFTVLREGPIATDQQMTGALPAGDKRGRKTVLY
jgi:hypothetical protein